MPAELFGDLVVTEQDGIGHIVFLDKGHDVLCAGFIKRNADHLQALRSVLFLKFDKPGNLHNARRAPCGPEIDQQDFILEVGGMNLGASQVGQFERRSRLAAQGRDRAGMAARRR